MAHCLQVNFEPGNSVAWGDAQLELLQFHFHTPSEHAWDGQRSAMEAHLVHRNTATGAAVLGLHTWWCGFGGCWWCG